jgi:acyl-ACP thioesterase
MQESSMQHTLGLKVSVWDLEDQHRTWVLIKMDVSFNKYPKLGDQIEVQTYPSGLEGFFTYRDYFVYDGEGKICATASSMWALMDTNTRKMMRIPESFSNLVYHSDIKLPNPALKRPKHENYDEKSEIKINYFHLDWNGHVNNVQIIKIILESLNTKTWYSKSLSNLKIQFKAEAILDQDVVIEHHQVSENQWSHRIINKDTGMEIAISLTEWNID